jgi:AraC family transcriptional regulator
MDDKPEFRLAPPRFATHRAFLVAGLSGRYGESDMAAIPAQWQRFVPYIGNIPGQVGQRPTYGICYNGDGTGIDYMCAVEVKDFSDVPRELARLSIGEHLYAVFTHKGHVTQIRAMWKAIFAWFPGSPYEMAQAPDFERYGETFDARTGAGEIEIWVPVKKKG